MGEQDTLSQPEPSSQEHKPTINQLAVEYENAMAKHRAALIEGGVKLTVGDNLLDYGSPVRNDLLLARDAYRMAQREQRMRLDLENAKAEHRGYVKEQLGVNPVAGDELMEYESPHLEEIEKAQAALRGHMTLELARRNFDAAQAERQGQDATPRTGE